MTEIDPGGVQRAKSENELLLARAKAIQGYATVEQSLCSLFAHLMGAPPDLAGIVFFRIVNSRSRNAILEGLLKRRAPHQYRAYWESLLKEINFTDQQRNEIVHWHTAVNVGQTVELRLIPPNFWIMTESTPYYTAAKLLEFEAKCDFLSRSMNMFYLLLRIDFPLDSRKAWHEICLQELTYPPPDTHPLSPNYKAP